MPSRRIAKVNRAILEALSAAILFELRDPRVKNVTILNVETTDDLKASKVRVGVRGDAKIQSLTLHGLESSRGFLQSKIAERLESMGVKNNLVDAAATLAELETDLATRVCPALGNYAT